MSVVISPLSQVHFETRSYTRNFILKAKEFHKRVDISFFILVIREHKFG